MKRITWLLSFLFGLAYLSANAHADSHDFFKGKTVRIVVGNSVGGAMDDWARFIALFLGKHIPGNPDVVVQNMPGAASIIAANHVYNVAKPDGLTLGLINPVIYLDQLLGAKEVKYDWRRFHWIGSPERVDQVLFMRTDAYKTLEDIRKAAEPPRCASLGRTGLGYFLPRLLEERLGMKLNIITGYGGGGEMNLAIEKGEAHCRFNGCLADGSEIIHILKNQRERDVAQGDGTCTIGNGMWIRDNRQRFAAEGFGCISRDFRFDADHATLR